MISILEKLDFRPTKENVEENTVSTRMEKGNSVIVVEKTFFPPDEIETVIYIISGKLDLDENKFERLTIIN